MTSHKACFNGYPFRGRSRKLESWFLSLLTSFDPSLLICLISMVEIATLCWPLPPFFSFTRHHVHSNWQSPLFFEFDPTPSRHHHRSVAPHSPLSLMDHSRRSSTQIIPLLPLMHTFFNNYSTSSGTQAQRHSFLPSPFIFVFPENPWVSCLFMYFV